MEVTVSAVAPELAVTVDDSPVVAVEVSEAPAITVEVVALGGGAGAAGALTFSGVAGENLSGHHAVYVASDGLVYLADPGDLASAAIGVTTGAAAEGDTVTVATAGRVNGFSGLVPGSVYWLNAAGDVLEDVPGSGFVQDLGTAIDAQTMVIRVGAPFVI